MHAKFLLLISTTSHKYEWMNSAYRESMYKVLSMSTSINCLRSSLDNKTKLFLQHTFSLIEDHNKKVSICIYDTCSRNKDAWIYQRIDKSLSAIKSLESFELLN